MRKFKDLKKGDEIYVFEFINFSLYKSEITSYEIRNGEINIEFNAFKYDEKIYLDKEDSCKDTVLIHDEYDKDYPNFGYLIGINEESFKEKLSETVSWFKKYFADEEEFLIDKKRQLNNVFSSNLYQTLFDVVNPRRFVGYFEGDYDNKIVVEQISLKTDSPSVVCQIVSIENENNITYTIGDRLTLTKSEYDENLWVCNLLIRLGSEHYGTFKTI